MSARTQSRPIPASGLVIALCLVFGVGSSHAQDASGASTESDDAENGVGGQGEEAQGAADDGQRARSTTERERTYRGVVPGLDPLKKRKRKNALSWIGFQPGEDGSARVFLRLANELPFEQSTEGRTLTVHLQGARFRFRNTRRRLDVHFFGTVLHQITSKRVSRRGKRGDRPARKAGIEVRIQFKEGADARSARATMKTEGDGYTYLYLDFDPPDGSSQETGESL